MAAAISEERHRLLRCGVFSPSVERGPVQVIEWNSTTSHPSWSVDEHLDGIYEMMCRSNQRLMPTDTPTQQLKEYRPTDRETDRQTDRQDMEWRHRLFKVVRMLQTYRFALWSITFILFRKSDTFPNKYYYHTLISSTINHLSSLIK